MNEKNPLENIKSEKVKTKIIEYCPHPITDDKEIFEMLLEIATIAQQEHDANIETVKFNTHREERCKCQTAFLNAIDNHSKNGAIVDSKIYEIFLKEINN